MSIRLSSPFLQAPLAHRGRDPRRSGLPLCTRRAAAPHTDSAPMGHCPQSPRRGARRGSQGWAGRPDLAAGAGGGSAGTNWASVTPPGYERRPDMPNLEGKVALITGGARGFGRAIARALAGDGADIAIADIAGELPSERVSGMSTRDDLERTKAEVQALGGRCIAIRANVADAGDCERMAGAVIEQFGRVDILAANAGVFSFGLSWELTEDDWDTVLGVNLKGVWLTTKYVV